MVSNFVVDSICLATSSIHLGDRKVAFANEACKLEYPSLDSLLEADDDASSVSDDPEATTWLSWIRRSRNGDSFQYGSVLWHATVVQSRWHVFTGMPLRNNVSTPRYTTPRKMNEFDMALELGCVSPEHYALLQSVDWSKTSLGPIDEWPPELCHAVPLILLNPEPSCIMWGTDRFLLYNEAYPTLIKQLHPMAMGKSAKISFAAWWAPFEALHQEVQRTGRTIRHKNSAVTMARSGDYFEEAFFTYSFIPIKNPNGSFLGILNLAIETTGQILSQRRLTNLLKTGEASSSMVSLGRFWRNVLQSFDFLDSEIPYAAIYSRDGRLRTEDLAAEDRPNPSDDKLFLEGFVGSHEDLKNIPNVVDLSGKSGLALAMKQSVDAPVPFVISSEDLANASLPELIVKDLTPQVSRVSVCPLQVSSMNGAIWIVFGVPKLRPVDHDYGVFVNLIKRQIETGANSLVLLAEERKGLEMSVELAKLEKLQLTKELEVQKREAEETAWRFYEFAKHSPVSRYLSRIAGDMLKCDEQVGVYTLGPSGEVLFANDAYFHLVSITRSTGDKVWRDNVHPEDVHKVDNVWQSLVSGEGHAHFEFRVCKNPEVQARGDEDYRFLSSTCFAELNPDKSLKAATGVIVDNTTHKALEREVAERLASALEAKRTQENFMGKPIRMHA